MDPVEHAVAISHVVLYVRVTCIFVLVTKQGSYKGLAECVWDVGLVVSTERIDP